MTLEQRIDNILGPWPTPDQTREGMLLLARQHDAGEERVTLDPAHKGRIARTADGAPWVPAGQYDELVARYTAAQVELDAGRRTIKELEGYLAERDADAELGRAIRELRPKEDDGGVTMMCSVNSDGETFYRIAYLRCGQEEDDAQTPWHADYRAAIRDYNERED